MIAHSTRGIGNVELADKGKKSTNTRWFPTVQTSNKEKVQNQGIVNEFDFWVKIQIDCSSQKLHWWPLIIAQGVFCYILNIYLSIIMMCKASIAVAVRPGIGNISSRSLGSKEKDKSLTYKFSVKNVVPLLVRSKDLAFSINNVCARCRRPTSAQVKPIVYKIGNQALSTAWEQILVDFFSGILLSLYAGYYRRLQPFTVGLPVFLRWLIC